MTATAFAGGGKLVGIDPALAQALLAVSAIQSPEEAAACLMEGLAKGDFLISAVPSTAERLADMASSMLAPGSDRKPSGGFPIIQTANMRIPANKVVQAGQMFADFAKIAQRHAGCLAYEPGVDPTDPEIFKLFEVWTDQESLDAHALAPESFEFVTRVIAMGAKDFVIDRPGA